MLFAHLPYGSFVATFLKNHSCLMDLVSPFTKVGSIFIFLSMPRSFKRDDADLFSGLFSKLAASFSKFPLVTEQIHLIFVPGPNDPWDSTMLPRQAIPPSIVKPLMHSSSQIPSDHLHFASNPCRIKWMSQEIVVFRENLASKMCRNVIEALKDPTVAADEENINITKFVSKMLLMSKQM
jgi:hypothetical protein